MDSEGLKSVHSHPKLQFKPRGVLVLLTFWQFSPERKVTGSLGATESEVWIGNLNVNARKATKHKLHKIWLSLKFCKIQENEHIPEEKSKTGVSVTP